MPRYKLTIEYDGTGFVGWQSQAAGISIQQTIAEAVSGFCGEAIQVFGAGRTDAGVHATGQVAHIDIEGKYWPPETVRDAVNFHLKPHAISIVEVARVSDAFDARFSAVKRHYVYRIINRRAPLALDRNRAWLVSHTLDTAAMSDAAGTLRGRHDFTTFRSSSCQAKSPIKTIDTLEVMSEGNEVLIVVSARSFMHNQVRSFAGALVHVGRDKWSVSDLRNALEARDRTRCAPVAPAHGLYLTQVDYPPADAPNASK